MVLLYYSPHMIPAHSIYGQHYDYNNTKRLHHHPVKWQKGCPDFSKIFGSRNRKLINNILGTKNFFHKVKLEWVTKSTVLACRSIVSFGERCGKVKKRNLVTLGDDIQDELRNFYRTSKISAFLKSSTN